MKNSFDFKSLFKRLPNLSIPKEFIIFGAGLSLVVVIGLVVGNMYLQEMLFFEGQEKSLQLFTEEELREYGEIYKEMSLDFQNEIGAYTQGFARKEQGSRTIYYVNRAGENIYYGIYNHEHPTLNRSKIHPHNNGENVNAADPIGEGIPYESNYDDHYNDFPNSDDVDATFIDTEEFKNGIKIKYVLTQGRGAGESNYKDILTVISMILDQKQGDNSFNVDDSGNIIDLKEKIPELVKRLFKMSHTYSGSVSELYSCEQGCRALFYYCNEEDNKFASTGIDLVPFDINPHDELDDYDSSDFEIVGPTGECEICGHNGKGCILDEEKCWHGSDSEEKGPHYLGRGMTSDFVDVCSKCHEVNDCQHECEGCGGEELGCIHVCDSGCYDCFCDGHEHWNCPGHFYVCCMGHRDISITVKIMYVDEMVNALKNGYGS